jgi:hypothetical protein
MILRDGLGIVFTLFFGAAISNPSPALAGSTINVQLHLGVSNPIYVNAGAVTIVYSYLLAYNGKSYATGDGGADDGASGATGDTISVYNSSGQVIASLPGGLNLFGGSGSGTVIWDNPAGQYIRLSGDIFVSGYGAGVYENWYIAQGPSIATGGDTPPGGPNTTPVSSVTQATKSAPTSSPNSNSPPAPPARTNIHAVIISGLPDPAKVITSPNVTLTGGIAALGRDNAPPSAPSAWSPGLQIVPDYALLTGEKIPPVTPNIIDVRIARHQVTADFPSPSPQPGN